VRTDGSEEEDEVAEVVIEGGAPGSAANTDDEDTNQEGKKLKAIPRKASPPSRPSKSGKATTPTSPSRSTLAKNSPARSSPRRNMKLPNRFPDSPASTRTPEGEKDYSAGSKRKATPGAASKKKGRTRVTVVRGKKTAPGGVAFLKDAEREGLTRPKKTIRRFAFDVDHGIDESQVRYAYSIVPSQKLDAGEVVDKIEELSQTRKDLKDTIKRQIEVKMVEHARRNGLTHGPVWPESLHNHSVQHPSSTQPSAGGLAAPQTQASPFKRSENGSARDPPSGTPEKRRLYLPPRFLNAPVACLPSQLACSLEWPQSRTNNVPQQPPCFYETRPRRYWNLPQPPEGGIS
jgi:hypothetical protein